MNDPYPPLPQASQQRANRSVGAILIDLGKLSVSDVESVLRLQKERRLRFGDAAVELGFVSAADVQRALALQFDYPCLQTGDESLSPELIAAFAPLHGQVEEYRALRNQLMARCFGPDLARRALAIVSPGRGEGRSHLAANLAVVFSQLGERTLLIDAALRHPRQHELFKLSNDNGLSVVLSGRAEIAAVQRIPALFNLWVLTAGPIPPNPTELLARNAFSRLLNTLAQDYEVIIVDTSAGNEGADAQAAAKQTHTALMLARRHKTSVKEVNQLATQLIGTHVDVVGSILVDF